MTQALLLTQCLQNDFVKPIARHEAQPNLLHIGHAEALRLVGRNPKEGPIARIMDWAYAQADSQLKLIHIRDWHDSTDMRQMDHLMHFGLHCEQDSEGADFVFDVPEDHDKEVAIVDTLTLNDFQDTNLAEVLAPFAGQKMRVGLIGVWTEAKMTYLAYELSSRYPEFELAVCSALSAGSSRDQHFIALQQMEKLLGVKVHHSMASFIAFLGGEAEHIPLTGWKDARHPVVVLNDFPPLSEGDSRLLRYLFRDSRLLRLERMEGGFSGNEVFATRSKDIQGHQQAAHVVKVGWHHLMGQERVAFEKIESILGNNAPRLVEHVEVGDRAALKYRYASMTTSQSRTFQSLWQDGMELKTAQKVIYTTFVEQLGRLYAAASYQKLDLLKYYEFSTQLAPEIRRSVEKIVGHAPDTSKLKLEVGPEFPNLCVFYEKSLAQLQSKTSGTGCYISYVHGDLNAANILMDEHENVWLIDFYQTHQGHVLRDLIKLENDLLYLMTPLESPADLEEAMEFSDFLMRIEDLRSPLPPPDKMPINNPHLQRSYALLHQLRSFYPELIHSDRNPLQLLVGQLRYAAHTLSFSEASEYQKKWALYSASLCAQEIEWRTLEQQGDLWIAWLSRMRTAPGRLGLTILPGRRDRRRVLKKDLARLKDEGVTHIVPLLLVHEMEDYGVPELLREYNEAGFEVKHLPIADQGIVSEKDMTRLLKWIDKAIQDQGQVLLHCVGGLGRSGMVAASYLRYRGLPARQALSEVRAVRSARAVESPPQEDFVQNYSP